jgi:hypothetical protein
MKGPHICDCLCALCERLGAGAFGPQPDGSPGVVVIRRRRGLRRQAQSRAKQASRVPPAAGAYLTVLASRPILSAGPAFPAASRPSFPKIEGGPRSPAALRSKSR